ncbi:hypothetical protein Ahy_A03g013694 isoform D [Arachis hypogaea]|uniref:Uncharacterized protein n=1 Tax=Arachis hypogaea TaxID=3818 RepID=A0A445DW14_ARAHY|nr:hypothetical protein Ahy_A03g013694 isoform D [Arachis hypogaea]
MREAMERPNDRKIVLRFNNVKQTIGDEAGLLIGVLGLLGSDYGKFSICKKSWHKITTKDKVYNECVKQIFHFDEDNEGTIKKNILKSMEKSWKEARLRLYSDFYEPTFTIEQNIQQRPSEIDREHWRWFLEKNTINRSKQLYTHTGRSKSFARRIEEESEQQRRRVSRRELWITVHKKRMVPISMRKQKQLIELEDVSSRVLSQNDSIAQVFGKEKLERVRGVDFGSTPSQLFGPNSHALGNGVQLEETQRKLLELQAELEGEKLKRKAMEDEAATNKKKMQAMESALIYLFQWQGEELPPDIAAGMSSVE